jgi:hypothetical protein
MTCNDFGKRALKRLQSIGGDEKGNIQYEHAICCSARTTRCDARLGHLDGERAKGISALARGSRSEAVELVLAFRVELSLE